jgi:hypothetical protein
MKCIVKALVQISILFMLFVSVTAHVARAQTAEPTNLVQVMETPPVGSFFSMQLWPSPPWPVDPFPDLPLYSSSEMPGQILV